MPHLSLRTSRRTKLGTVAATVVALCLTSFTPAQAVGDAGAVYLSGITAPETVSFDNPQVSYDAETDTGSICFVVYGLEDQQTAFLADVSINVDSSDVKGDYPDSETYATDGYDDGSGAIVGDLCVAVPTDAVSLIDPIAFDAMTVSGTFSFDDTTGGGGTVDGGGGSIGVVENGFDFSGIMGPDGLAVDSPSTSTDPETGITSVCMNVSGLEADQFAYLRNVNMTVEADGFLGDYPDSESYMMQASDNGDGSTWAGTCLPVNEEAAQYVVDNTFTNIVISADLFVPSVSVAIEDPSETGVGVDANFSSTYNSENDTTSGCFTVTGIETNVPIYLTDMTLTVSQGGDELSATLDDQLFSLGLDDGDTACLYVDAAAGADVADLGDLQVADSISLSAVVHYGSTISTAFKNFMSTKGVFVRSIGIVRRGAGAAIEVTMRPKAKKPLYLAPSKLKFDGLVLTPLQKVWVLPASEDTYFQIGYSASNFALDHRNGSLTATLTTMVPSTLKTTGIKLPAGITLETVDPANWGYIAADPERYDPVTSDKTWSCLALKNSTKKSIMLDLNWTWKFGTSRYISKGNQYTEIPAKTTLSCVSAIDDWNGFMVPGDVRFGSTVTVTGTATLAAATKIRTSGVSKPSGYTVTSNPAYYHYDPKTNKTTVSMAVKNSSEDSVNDLVLSNAKINGVAVAAPVVAAVWASPETGFGSWYFEIGTVKGDIRANSSVVITGALSESDPTPVDSQQLTNTAADDRTQCVLNSSTKWVYSVSRDSTAVTFSCTNYTRATQAVDFSGVSLDYSADGETTDTYEAETTAASVTVPKGAGYFNTVTVTAFRVPGDIRTGVGQVSIYGEISFG